MKSIVLSALLLSCVGVLFVAVTDASRVIGQVSDILEETDAERWTDISVKKLEAQKVAHEEEMKVDWKGLDNVGTEDQPRVSGKGVRQSCLVLMQ